MNLKSDCCICGRDMDSVFGKTKLKLFRSISKVPYNAKKSLYCCVECDSLQEFLSNGSYVSDAEKLVKAGIFKKKSNGYKVTYQHPTPDFDAYV